LRRGPATFTVTATVAANGVGFRRLSADENKMKPGPASGARG